MCNNELGVCQRDGDVLRYRAMVAANLLLHNPGLPVLPESVHLLVTHDVLQSLCADRYLRADLAVLTCPTDCHWVSRRCADHDDDDNDRLRRRLASWQKHWVAKADSLYVYWSTHLAAGITTGRATRVSRMHLVRSLLILYRRTPQKSVLGG